MPDKVEIRDEYDKVKAVTKINIILDIKGFENLITLIFYLKKSKDYSENSKLEELQVNYFVKVAIIMRRL